MEGCCYCFGLRMGCILGGLWLLIYYSCLAYLMYYDIENTRMTETADWTGSSTIQKITIGFWVLGIACLVMDFMTLMLIFGALMKRFPLIIIFIFGQIPPIAVESYYLLVAIIFGIETEAVFMYLLPLIFLVYMDFVAYSYMNELRKIKRLGSVSVINIEY